MALLLVVQLFSLLPLEVLAQLLKQFLIVKVLAFQNPCSSTQGIAQVLPKVELCLLLIS